jgi:hypothetical protein
MFRRERRAPHGNNTQADQTLGKEPMMNTNHARIRIGAAVTAATTLFLPLVTNAANRSSPDNNRPQPILVVHADQHSPQRTRVCPAADTEPQCDLAASPAGSTPTRSALQQPQADVAGAGGGSGSIGIGHHTPSPR